MSSGTSRAVDVRWTVAGEEPQSRDRDHSLPPPALRRYAAGRRWRGEDYDGREGGSKPSRKNRAKRLTLLRKRDASKCRLTTVPISGARMAKRLDAGRGHNLSGEAASYLL